MIIQKIQNDKNKGKKSLAVLVDPDKIESEQELKYLTKIANENYLDYFFVGGSLITRNNLSEVISFLKSNTDVPVVLFPGSNMHLDSSADALLFLSLISGRNPELLIGQHVVAAPILKNSGIEVLPTGYLLISSEKATSVSYMSNTTPIPSDKHNIAASTAMAGELLGLKLIYLDSGSGGTPITPKMINKISRSVELPIIVGGGIDTAGKAMDALDSGADIVVIGNAIEKNPDLMIEVSEKIYDRNSNLNIH